LASSKREEMKRKLMELIDNIHAGEQVDLTADIEKVKSLMKEWQKEDYEPVNFAVVIE
jgi:hypothetical protein|tara:strand:+ start:124 stop:297 length:174 start_codon:yes stop_codon:yes gene_type:complete